MDNGCVSVGIGSVLNIMRYRTILLCLLLCAVLLSAQGCSRRTDTQTPSRTEKAAASDAGTEQTASAPLPDTTEAAKPLPSAPVRISGALSDSIDRVLRKYGTVGAQVAVIRGGEVQAVHAFGYADKSRQIPVQTDTKFRCASLSKLTTAMTVMALQETGRLDIQKDVGEYLRYTVRNPRFPQTPINCSMLMTHTSSVTDSAAFLQSRNSSSSVPLQTLLSRKDTYTAHQPGTQYVYSNFGVAVLAAAAECAAGQSFDLLAGQYIFQPLGIDAAYLAADLQNPSLTAGLYGTDGGLLWSVPRQMRETKADAPGQTHHLYQGNLTISAADYARILCVLLNDGKAGQTAVLQPQSVRQILSAQFTNQTLTQGFCIKRLDHVAENRSMWCHTGQNFGAYTSFAVDPSDQSGVVVFTSGANAAKDGSELYNVCTEIIRLCYAQL